MCTVLSKINSIRQHIQHFTNVIFYKSCKIIIISTYAADCSVGFMPHKVILPVGTV